MYHKTINIKSNQMNALSQVKKHHVLSALVAAPIFFSCTSASAEDAVAPAPPYTLSFNLGITPNTFRAA